MIRPLTSFRFLAALAVFGSHLGFLSAYPSTASLHSRVLSEGYAGVTFFFILSGFILTHTYRERLRGDASIGNLFEYVMARVGRIVPVHVLTFALSIPLALQAIELNGARSVAVTGVLNLLLIQSYVPIETVYFSFNMPSWSLSNEFLFYALLPAAIALGHRVRHLLTLRMFGVVVLSVWSITLLTAWAFQADPNAHWFFYVNPVMRLGDFLIGGWLALVFATRRWRFPNRVVATTFEMLALGLLAVLIARMADVPQSIRLGAYYQPAMALVIFTFAQSRGALSTLLSSRPLVYLGEISFGFYMLHLVVLQYLLAHYGAIPAHGLWLSAGAFIATLVLSAVQYHAIEDPLRRRIRTWSRGRAQRLDRAATATGAATVGAAS